jgi:phage terminase small subunit
MKKKTTQIPTLDNQLYNLILEKDPGNVVAAELVRDAAKDYIEAREFLKKNGFSYTSETVTGFILREYPQVRHYQDAWNRILLMLKEFKCTPKSGGQTKSKTKTSPIIQLVQKR